jgi:hypothetical protein
LQTLGQFNGTYSGLFGVADDESRDDEGHRPGIVEQFHKRYGWIYSTGQVAEFERITMDDTWELPVVQVLNDLAYLKSKVAFDRELNRKR